MKKDIKRGILSLIIILTIYILIMFLVPFHKGIIFGISVVFTLISFALTSYAIYVAFIKNRDAKSRFYGFPIVKLVVYYCVAQIVAGIVFSLLGKTIAWWIAFLIYTIMLGATLLGVITADAVIDEIHTQEDKKKSEVAVIRSIQSKMKSLSSESKDLKEFAEEILYSDPVSKEGTYELEQQLVLIISELEKAVSEQDKESVKSLCKKGINTLRERNRLCKMSK